MEYISSNICNCFFFWTFLAPYPDSCNQRKIPSVWNHFRVIWEASGAVLEAWTSLGGAGSHQGVEHGSTAAPRGSGGEDGSSNWARPEGAGAPLARIVEPMAPNRVPKWLQNGSQKRPRANGENRAPVPTGAHLSLSRRCLKTLNPRFVSKSL